MITGITFLTFNKFYLRATLAELNRNDKRQINVLTILAEDYASISDQIAQVIEETLYAVI